MDGLLLKESFKDALAEHFCKSTQSALSKAQVDDFIDFVMEYRLVPETTIKIYAILAEFEKASKLNPGKSKAEYVQLMCAQFGLKSSVISNILKDHKNRFQFQHNPLN